MPESIKPSSPPPPPAPTPLSSPFQLKETTSSLSSLPSQSEPLLLAPCIHYIQSKLLESLEDEVNNDKEDSDDDEDISSTGRKRSGSCLEDKKNSTIMTENEKLKFSIANDSETNHTDEYKKDEFSLSSLIQEEEEEEERKNKKQRLDKGNNTSSSDELNFSNSFRTQEFGLDDTDEDNDEYHFKFLDYDYSKKNKKIRQNHKTNKESKLKDDIFRYVQFPIENQQQQQQQQPGTLIGIFDSNSSPKKTKNNYNRHDDLHNGKIIAQPMTNKNTSLNIMMGITSTTLNNTSPKAPSIHQKSKITSIPKLTPKTTRITTTTTTANNNNNTTNTTNTMRNVDFHAEVALHDELHKLQHQNRKRSTSYQSYTSTSSPLLSHKNTRKSQQRMDSFTSVDRRLLRLRRWANYDETDDDDDDGDDDNQVVVDGDVTNNIIQSSTTNKIHHTNHNYDDDDLSTLSSSSTPHLGFEYEIDEKYCNDDLFRIDTDTFRINNHGQWWNIFNS